MFLTRLLLQSIPKVLSPIQSNYSGVVLHTSNFSEKCIGSVKPSANQVQDNKIVLTFACTWLYKKKKNHNHKSIMVRYHKLKRCVRSVTTCVRDTAAEITSNQSSRHELFIFKRVMR